MTIVKVYINRVPTFLEWQNSLTFPVFFSQFLPPANEVWGKVIFSEACVKNSVHGGGGVRRIRRDTVNERAIRILLECIPVQYFFSVLFSLIHFSKQYTVHLNITKNNI